MKPAYVVILLAAICILAAAVRCVGLGANPVGLVDDEADEGYDAYSLLLTGRDQWGVRLPLLAFKGFGDYRAPLYTYLAVPSIKAFGLTPFAVRLPSAIFGSLTVLAVFFLVRELFRESKHTEVLALLSAILVAISPWHIGMSRIASEAIVSGFLVTVGLYLFLVSRRNTHVLPVAGLILGLSAYAYTADIVFVPMVTSVLIYIFRDTYVKKILPWTMTAIILFLAVIAPIGLAAKAGSTVRVQQVNLLNDSGLINLLNEKRGACIVHIPAGICRLVYNKYYVFAEKFVFNYYHHFSPNLLSIAGTATQYSVLPDRGLLYVAELPLVLLGIYVSFRSKSKAGIFMVLFLLLSALPDSITSDGHFSRYFISIPAWQILTGMGMLQLFELRRSKRFIFSLIGMLYLVDVCSFSLEYMTYFPYRFSIYSHFGYKALVVGVEDYRNRYDKVLVSSSVNDAKQYIFYLFYTKYNPVLFQKHIEVEKGLDALGWVRVERIGSVYFVSDLPTVKPSTVIQDRELFIGSPAEFPKNVYIPVKFAVKDTRGDVIFQAVDAGDYIRCVQISCVPSM